jgi:hypothetical protein
MSEYDEIGWSDELNRVAGSVQPTPEAGVLVRDRLRRRQRRRAVLAVGASAAAVAVVAGSTFALTRPSAVEPGPAAPTGTATTDADLFSCPQGLDLLQNPPPIPDLAEQERLIGAIDGERYGGFTIHAAHATHLGVVALVEGDVDRARSVLTAEGVAFVDAWDPALVESGLDETTQVSEVIQWQLDPVAQRIALEHRSDPGFAGLSVWQDAGAVVLQWKSPVPPEVQELEGTRSDGVKVLIWPTTYSEKDLRSAADRVFGQAVDEEITMSTICADFSGIVVGIKPPLDGRRAELQRKLSDLAGVPVMVIPQEAAVAL